LQRIRGRPPGQASVEHSEVASRKFYSVIPITRLTIYIVSNLVVTQLLKPDPLFGPR
jgi:hypothetical protein